jgi:HD-GYP domain-containing protein (c-di-GMP phosphodiesterase class II)
MNLQGLSSYNEVIFVAWSRYICYTGLIFTQGASVSICSKLQQSLSRFFSAQPQSSQSDSLISRLEQENHDLRETNLALLESLGAVVDALTPYTLYHSIQVATYARALAQSMDLSLGQQELIFRAGLVHDVGMITLSSAAIANPGPLSDEQMDLLRLHPTIGGEIVGRMQYLRDLAPLVHYHHERFDGAGYPDRLIGDEIPIGARIMALSDSLDAMLTGRPRRPARSLQEVMVEVQRCSGTQFDPVVVHAFFELTEVKDPTFFSNSNQYAPRDMLLTIVGISSGKANKVLQES